MSSFRMLIPLAFSVSEKWKRGELVCFSVPMGGKWGQSQQEGSEGDERVDSIVEEGMMNRCYGQKESMNCESIQIQLSKQRRDTNYQRITFILTSEE